MTSQAALKRGQHLAMTEAAREAYNDPAKASPYLAASDMDCAWRIGRWLRADGRKPPLHVRPSRPWTYHVSVDNSIKATFKVRCPWQRESSPTIIEDMTP